MLALRQPKINRGQKAVPVAVTAPVGGWNARDGFDDMDPTDATVLDNWFPSFGKVSVRFGSSAYANTLGGGVKMLAEFLAGSSRKFIAGANGNIWDISSTGAGVSLASGYGADNWQTAQFDDSSGGARMGLVNGTDAPQQYNGTAVSAMTISGTGLTTSTLNGIHIHKSRSYFWDSRTQDYWYSATNSLGGVLTKFPMGRVQGTGGNMLAMGTWSHDAGSGLGDYAVFVLSSGDVLVYSGSDPSSATDWALVGRYNIGAPIAKEAIKKIGSELLLVTKAGYVPISSMVKGGQYNDQASSISSKIRGAALSATSMYSANNGWQVLHYPSQNMLIVNVPTSTTVFYQHVMNTETKAWCRFKGLNATVWGLYNDAAYYGTTAGTVLKFDPTATSDNGTAIDADAQTAWTYLGDRRRAKRATAVRFNFATTGAALSGSFGVGFDYKTIGLSAFQIAGTSASSPWDTSDWDTTSWGDESISQTGWYSAHGNGYVLASRIRLQSSTTGADWYSTTYLVEPGGIL
ncbi:MAG: hypothetical protein QM813_16975 [Verrucomicrobiota bacterium]